MNKIMYKTRLNKNVSRKRSGVSPVIATTIIIAITVTLGLGLWAYANSGVGSAMQSYSDAVIDYGNHTMGDRFVITNMDFDNPSANHVSFWIFNSGINPITISGVVLTDRSACDLWDPIGLAQQNPSDPAQPLTVFKHELKKFDFDSGGNLAGCAGKTFELRVVSATDSGGTGLSQTFIKKE